MAKNLRTSLKQSIRASSKASLVGSNVFGSSPLDLRFALQKTLDPRITFTRASSGTFVGSDGVLRTAVTNLLLRSEEFDNASWTKSTGTPETAITANAIASPSGPVTADLFYAVNTGAGVRFTIQSITKAASPIQYTYSLYIKAKEVTFATFSCDDGAGNGFSAGVNLSTGATTGGAVGTGASFTSVGAINVGNGWYRCSITGTSNSATTVRVAINLATSLVNGFPSVTLNANDGLYVWGAQLEQSSTAGEYIPTTSTINSAPRFDHNPTTGESLGLLVEEARTNLLLRSEDITVSPWTTFGSATRTANTVTAPDGSLTADSVTLPVSSGLYQSTSASASTAYTFSIWIRSDATRSVNILINTNLSDPTIKTVTATTAWQRFDVTKTTAVGTTSWSAQVDSGGGNTFYVWGGQMEVGAFPTSYIPTTSATATRAADVASITGTNFSSWYNQTEGTVFAEAIPRASGFNGGLISFDNGTTDERIQARLNSGLAASLVVSDGAVVQANILSLNTISAGALARGGYVYKADDFAVTLNGTAPVSDTSGTLPTPTQATVGNAVGASYLNGTIKRLTYWPVRLSNTTLQAITTP